MAGAHPRRALQGLQLEAGAHLVEVAHHGDVGDDRLVAAVGVQADEPLGLQPLQRLAHRGARHADDAGQLLLAEAGVERQLAHQQLGLEHPVGLVAAGTSGCDRLPYVRSHHARCPARVGSRTDRSPSDGHDRHVRDRLFRRCVQLCIQPVTSGCRTMSPGERGRAPCSALQGDVGAGDAPPGAVAHPRLRLATDGRVVAVDERQVDGDHARCQLAHRRDW